MYLNFERKKANNRLCVLIHCMHNSLPTPTYPPTGFRLPTPVNGIQWNFKGYLSHTLVRYLLFLFSNGCLGFLISWNRRWLRAGDIHWVQVFLVLHWFGIPINLLNKFYVLRCINIICQGNLFRTERFVVIRNDKIGHWILKLFYQYMFACTLCSSPRNTSMKQNVQRTLQDYLQPPKSAFCESFRGTSTPPLVHYKVSALDPDTSPFRPLVRHCYLIEDPSESDMEKIHSMTVTCLRRL